MNYSSQWYLLTCSLTYRLSRCFFFTYFYTQHEEIIRTYDESPLYLMPINSIGTGCATYGFIEAIEWMRFDTKDGTRSLNCHLLIHSLIY